MNLLLLYHLQTACWRCRCLGPQTSGQTLASVLFIPPSASEDCLPLRSLTWGYAPGQSVPGASSWQILPTQPLSLLSVLLV